MKIQKIIAQTISLTFLTIALSSCGGKKQKNADSANQASESNLEANQNPQNFDVVDGEAAANAINAQSQAKIDEIEVVDRVLFDLNSTSIAEDAKKILDTQIAWLNSEKQISITVEGHCDERGTREYNLALGEKRANAVKQYLVSGGIQSSRIKTISYGKERPDFVGTGEEVWSKNRRATVVVN